MSAYNSESALARLLRTHYTRGDDEARALLRGMVRPDADHGDDGGRYPAADQSVTVEN